MIKISHWRLVHLFALLVCVFLLAGAAYMQLVLGLQPCPLCIIQRVIILIMGLLFLVGVIYVPQAMGRKIFGCLTLLLSAAGIAVSARHVWLIHRPAKGITSCGADISVYINNLPITQTIKLLFQGTGDCANETWQFLGLNLPEWMLVFLVFFAVIGVWEMLQKD